MTHSHHICLHHAQKRNLAQFMLKLPITRNRSLKANNSCFFVDINAYYNLQ